MLIENKFIYINLPRCASTSFHISCLKYGLDIKHSYDFIHLPNPTKLSPETDNELIADGLVHSHERLMDLRKKFGSEIPVISVKRDPYERYISLWKHIIDELHRIGETEISEIFKNLTTDEVLSYTELDISSNDRKFEFIKKFLKKNKVKTKTPYVTIFLHILMSPTSYFHHHDKSIIWFDIKELDKLEKWVSEILNMDFKLEKVNSSQHFECLITNDDYFKKKYDLIYKNCDKPKIEKTLL